MSLAHEFLSRLLEMYPTRELAREALGVLLAERSNTELAALYYDWSFWARPEQRLPTTRDWESVGFCCGRGAGKTRACVEYVLGEIAAGRARRVAIIGPNEPQTVEVLIHGESGFLARAPFWMGADFSAGVLSFANGATCALHHATSPASLRGAQFDTAYCTEVASWPQSTGADCLEQARDFCLRLGSPARFVWDSTPKRRNPLIRSLLARHEADPRRHLLVRGHSRANAINLAPRRVDEWEREKGNTTVALEELEGVFLDEAEDQILRPSAVVYDGAPARFDRVLISVDPSSGGKRSDACGAIVLGVANSRIYVLANLTSKSHPGEWGPKLVHEYLERGGSLILCETNHAGPHNRNAFARGCDARGVTLNEIPEDATTWPVRNARTVHYQPITSRTSKAARAQEAAAWIESGHVRFCQGALGDLVERMALFDGARGGKDDAVDALCAGILRLAPSVGRADRAAGTTPGDFRAMAQLQRSFDPAIQSRNAGDRRIDELRREHSRGGNLARLIGFGGSGGGRI